MDETAIQVNRQRQRVLLTSQVTYTLGAQRSQTLFGFLALNGRSLASRAPNSCSSSFLGFLLAIRLLNPSQPLIIILDNARIHHAKMIRSALSYLNIQLVHLPPYSPDLNPIECAFKDLKYQLSSCIHFAQLIDQASTVLTQLLTQRGVTYTQYWNQQFLSSK